MINKAGLKARPYSEFNCVSVQIESIIIGGSEIIANTEYVLFDLFDGMKAKVNSLNDVIIYWPDAKWEEEFAN